MMYPEMSSEEKDEMWSSIEDWYALPEDERNPKTQKALYESYQIPERTFYQHTASDEFNSSFIRKALKLAKKRLPKVTRKLADNAEEGKEKSIEMFMEYVGEISKKLDITTGGDKLSSMSFTEEEKRLYETIRLQRTVLPKVESSSAEGKPINLGDGQ